MKLSDIYKDSANVGMTLESPQFEVSFNNPPKDAGGKSSATLDFKIYYETDPSQNGDVTAEDMQKVRNLAYQILRDTNRLTLPVLGDGSGDGSFSLQLKSISAKPMAGTDFWDISCKYDDSRSSGGQTQNMQLKNFQFSTQGRTSHIIQSLGTVDAINYNGVHINYGGGNISNNCYNFQGMIGFNDGEFAGVDVKRPNLTFSRDIWILHENMDFGLIRSLAGMTGSVNEDHFYGFDPGEVLFAGVSQGQKATLNVDSAKILYWNITLSFEVSANAWIEFGGGLIFKRGWDYIWYLNQKTTMTSNMGSIVGRTPIQATVEQVYPYQPFCPYFGFGWNDSLNDGGSFFDG